MRKLLTIILSLLMTLFIGAMTACENSSFEETQVSNIFLSKTELELGVGETYTLVATISPNTSNVVLQWTSSDLTVATVKDGKVTALSEGNVVIKVEEPNGLLAVCNVTVKMKTGKLTGDVSYKYNNYVGNKPDTGAQVILVSKKVKSLPDNVGYGIMKDAGEGVYSIKVDGSGKYTFDRLPIGEYYVVIISRNTNENMDYVTGTRSWGDVYLLFSETGKEKALSTAKVFKTRTTTITIEYGETTTYSYDFGITWV